MIASSALAGYLEANAAAASRGRRGHELTDRLEHDVKLAVVLALERGESLGDCLVRHEELTQPHERAHDGDVGLNRGRAPEHAREHRDALFGECVWQVAPSSGSL